MNQLTKDIMKQFDLTAEAAEGIKAYIYDFGIDAPEDEDKDYRQTLNVAYDKWRSVELKKLKVFIHD